MKSLITYLAQLMKLPKSYFFYFPVILLVILFSASCGGGGSNAESILSKTPSNLVVNFELKGKDVQNPNGDGSGVLTLLFSADNATLYKVNFGDGIVTETANKSLSFTYTESGTKTQNIIVSAYNGTKFISKTVSVTVYVAQKLIWADEFNVDGPPNSNFWGFDLGTGSGGWGNNEAQYYTDRPENVKVENGFLKITAKRESFSGSAFTSARIKTQNKFSFKYGRVEIRAKLPEGGGTWPALWMLGNNINTVGWPQSGEIDIMEHVGNNLGKIFGTLHHPGHSGGNGDSGSVTVSNVSSEFHIYTVDWTPISIKFSVDNQVFFTFSNNANLPFNQNFFLIINCAMGGNFGGNIDPNFTNSTFEVDYIRIFS